MTAILFDCDFRIYFDHDPVALSINIKLSVWLHSHCLTAYNVMNAGSTLLFSSMFIPSKNKPKRQHKLSHGSFCFNPHSKSTHTTILCTQCVCSLQSILISIYSVFSFLCLCLLFWSSNHCLFWMRWTSKSQFVVVLRGPSCVYDSNPCGMHNILYSVCFCSVFNVLHHFIPSHVMAASMQTRQCDDSPFFLCPFSRFVFLLRFALWLLSVCDFVLISSPLCACTLMHLLWWWWRLRRDGNRNWMSGSQWFHSLSIDVICCSINQYIVLVGSWMFSAFAACTMCRNMSTFLGTTCV